MKNLNQNQNKHVFKKGLFFTFEGGEGSGKTTLLQRLHLHLSSLGYPICLTRAPGGTKLGESIREILLHKKDLSLCKISELLLFLSDRAQHVEEIILPALKRCEIVLCDRFNDSTIAYQGAAREAFDIEHVENLCRFASHNVLIDLTFYLDLDPALGLKRAHDAIEKDGKKNYDRLENEKLHFHEKVRKAYLELASRNKNRIHVLDAAKPKEEVYKEALSIIESKLYEASHA